MCIEFNQGNCPRMNTYDAATNTCKVRQGTNVFSFKHICSFNKANNKFCTLKHPETTHYPAQQKPTIPKKQ